MCDTRAHTVATSIGAADERKVPVCGACILIVDRLRADATSLRVLHGDPDETPAVAVERLRGTRHDDGEDAIDRLREHLESISYHYPDLTPEQREDYIAYEASREAREVEQRKLAQAWDEFYSQWTAKEPK